MLEPTAANTLAMDATANSAHGQHPSQSCVEPDRTAVASPVGDATHDDTIFEPGLRLALFSTELGTRPQRKATSPPDALPIARSNPIQAVVETSLFWRRKLTRASMSIFPNGKWAIEDLWDAEDIQIYTPDHCREVLTFMSRDNFYCARALADEVSRKYPEQVVKTIASSSLEGMYDANKPFSFLDEVFIHGESDAYPRQMLWHAAYMMRASMLEIRANEQLAAKPPVVQQNVMETSRNGPLTAKASLEPSSATSQQLSAPFVPPPPSQFIAPPAAPGGKRPSGYGPPHPGAYHGQQIGHIMGGEVVRNPKTRPYNPAGLYGENHSQLAQGACAPRSSSGTAHSPHFNLAAMAMGQAVLPSQYPMQPYPQGYQLPSPSLYPNQPYHQGSARPVPLLQHQAYMPSPPMVPSNMHQALNDRSSRGASFGDVTNYYANNGAPLHIDSRRAGRRNSSYGNGNGSLYDPYNGTRPAFNDPNVARRSSRGGFMDQPGRSRKPPVPDNRSRNGSYSTDWNEMAGNGSRYSRSRTVDDPAIISDPLRGCHQKWIGPENHTVNELFVSDLPDDVKDNEVKEMFAREINIPPLRVIIKKQPGATHSHAFALFTTASEAKLGLKAGDAGPKVRGIPVRITVPRRFYQKSEEYHNHYEAQKPASKSTEERDTRRAIQASSHAEERVATKIEAQPAKLQYSPQDARSDLQKKTRPLSPDTNSVSPTDSDTQVMTPQSSQEAQLATERLEADKEGITDEVVESTAEAETTDSDKEEPETAIEVHNALKAEQPTVLSASKDTDSVKKLSSALRKMQHMISETGTIVEESVSQSTEHLTMGHARVGSQTKAPFEVTQAIPDGPKKVPMVVKIPGPAKDDLVSAKLTLILMNEEKAKDISEVEVLPAPVQELSSDDEADPNTSFQSGQEVVDSIESTSVPKVGSPSTSHGNEPGTATTVENSAVEKSSSPLSTAADATSHHTPVEADQKSTAPISMTVANSEENHDTAVSAKSTETTNATTSLPSTETMKQQGLQKTPIAKSSTIAGSIGGGGNSTTPANMFGTADTTVSQSSTATMKNQGPQQTPSLNPFAKLSKSQRKKDRQQKKKKKDSKKEQEDKTGKAKVGNASTDAVSNPPVCSADIEPDVPVNGNDSYSSGNKAQTPVSPTDANVQALQAATDTKGKGKAAAAVSDEASVVDGKDEETISGKQTGGVTTNIPGEIDSVTPKAKAAQKTTAPEVKDFSGAPAFTFRAQSHDHNGGERASDQSALTAAFITASTGGSVNANDARAAPTIKATVPAVPIINFNNPLSFARHSRSSSASVTNTTPKQLPLHAMPGITPQSDAASNASSETLHPSEGAQPSPSPTAEIFHTPLQTPTIPSVTQDETPKPKKNKNKKKKKKKSAAASAAVLAADAIPKFSFFLPDDSHGSPADSIPKINPTSSDGSYGSALDAIPNITSTSSDGSYGWAGRKFTADPFGNQMSHIEAIREATRDPKLYYNMVNRQMEESAAKDKADVGLKRKKIDWPQVEAFMKGEHPAINFLREHCTAKDKTVDLMKTDLRKFKAFVESANKDTADGERKGPSWPEIEAFLRENPNLN